MAIKTNPFAPTLGPTLNGVNITNPFSATLPLGSPSMPLPAFLSNPAVIQGIGMGLSGLSNMLGGGANRELQREQLAEQRRQFDAQLAQGQAQQGLGATQLNPLAQQQFRQRNALVEQLLKGMSPVSYADGKFTGGLNNIDPAMFQRIASFFSPEARQAAEQQFAGQANAASGGRYGQPDFGALGYPQAAGTSVSTDPTTRLLGMIRDGSRRPSPMGTQTGVARPRFAEEY